MNGQVRAKGQRGKGQRIMDDTQRGKINLR